MLLFSEQPAHAADVPTIEALVARIEAQDKRIAQLEGQLRELNTASSPSGGPEARTLATPTPPRADPAIKLRGRLQADALVFARGDGPTPQGTQLRRFYLGVEGKLDERTRFVAEADFAGNRVSLQEVYLAYRPSERSELIVGHHQTPNSLDAVTSDLTLVFLERSVFATAFTPSKRIGIGAHAWGGRWGIRAGLFGENDDTALDGARDEGWSVNARASGDLLEGDDALHVGLSAYYAEPSATDRAARIVQRPETNRAPPLLDSGLFAVDRSRFVGAELGYGAGPFTAQAEGGVVDFAGPIISPRFSGFSGQVAWRPTGEPRLYDARYGVFGRVTPRRPFDQGGPGAIEVGLRLTRVDLSDEIMAGVLTTYGAALNWYPVPHVRFGANLIRARVERTDRSTERDHFTIRVQLDW